MHTQLLCSLWFHNIMTRIMKHNCYVLECTRIQMQPCAELNTELGNPYPSSDKRQGRFSFGPFCFVIRGQ